MTVRVPRVSVVISPFNAEPWIAATLDSVLNQRIDDLEVVVVDGGSTDRTRDIVAAYGPPVRLIAPGRLGKSAGKNLGITAAQGDVIALIDADDLWLPGKLERQIHQLDASPSLGWSYTDCVRFDDSTGAAIDRYSQRVTLHRGDILRPLFLENFIPSPTPLIRREVFQQVGMFDEALTPNQPEDWDLWLRIAARYPAGLVAEPLARYRVHAQSLTAREDPMATYAGILSIIDRACQREPDRLGPLRHVVIARHALSTGRSYAGKGRAVEARRMFAQAIRHQPTDPRAYALFAATILGGGALRRLRAIRHRVINRRTAETPAAPTR